jgi:hypothetical protein
MTFIHGIRPKVVLADNRNLAWLVGDERLLGRLRDAVDAHCTRHALFFVGLVDSVLVGSESGDHL